MDISNKNTLRQKICIFLVLTLCICTGLCAGADFRTSKITLAVGEPHDSGDGYSITATKIDLRADTATFELIVDGASVDSMTVKNGERFRLKHGENFYFEATLDTVFAGIAANLVQLIDSESEYTPGAEGGGTTDTTPPTVTGNSPTGENVPVTTEITITFSEQMNKESIEDALYVHDSMQNRIHGEFSWDGDTMIFAPRSNLNHDTRYFVYLSDGAPDLAYNSLDYEWNFKTGLPNNPPDTPETPSGPSTGYARTSHSYSSFTKDPDGDQIRYIFDWGDGTVAETEFVDSGRSASQSHVWDGEGEYSVRVMAEDGEGSESDWSPPLVVVISRRPLPTAAISANPTVITEGETVSFGAEGSMSGNPDVEIISYDWDFGDESMGAGVNVEHTYPRSGRYTATLTVTDHENLSATDSVSITVEPASVLSISIFTDPVPSGESGEVLVRVTSNGDPMHDARVYLSVTTGSLDQDEGVTDRDGEFVSIFTAPIVDVTERYTIYAEAEVEGMSGEGSESDLIVVGPNIPPTAYLDIYPNPAEEGERVTLDGWSEDGSGGEVVECLWTFPDGSTHPYYSDSSELTLEPDEIQAGVYRFAVMDDGGVWSETADLELHWTTPLESPTSTPTSEEKTDPFALPVAVAAVAALAAGALLVYRLIHPPDGSGGHELGREEEKEKEREKEEKQQYGTIYATSDPKEAMVSLDVLNIKEKTPVEINNVAVGTHIVLFAKSGYFGCMKDVTVHPNKRAEVHCNLIEIPGVKLKLTPDSAEILADGESKSTITIEIIDKKDRRIPVPRDAMISLETDNGVIESPVRVCAGDASTTAVLTASESSGTATVKAELEVVLKLKGETTVEFMERKTESDKK